ncbi:MAG: type III pantothenate kinase [Clostridiales bacterium]|nr:type III pantothenate kinase [Clostridiales bacterium]
MILAVDIGNTNITFGIFDGDNLVGTFRMTTQISRTSDEYGIFLCQVLEHRSIDPAQIEGVVISTVVPKIMYSFESAIHKYFQAARVINIGVGIKTGIKIGITNPHEIGADRIVDAVAGYELYGGPILVLDFGTATTHDLITADGTLVAGVTTPGIRISANALWSDTAKLPEVAIEKPPTILAKNTIHSMQAGLFYGTVGQTEYIIKKMKEESGIPDIKVVATGGLGKLISSETDAIMIYDSKLTLKGLKILYDKNSKVME